MKYNFKLFYKSFYKSLFRSKSTHARLTKKRIWFLILFYTVWPTWGVILWLTFFLDHLFFARFTSQSIDKPLFITGNFRSGSTYLQRLIAKDQKQFASARTWDIFLSPSITLTKLFSIILAVDGIFRNPLKKAFKKFDQRTLGQVDIHRISFFEPEEDENFLLHIWSSYFSGILFPFMEDYQQFLYFDQVINQKNKNRIMHFYNRVLQRFLYSRGGKHKLLSKNPSICPKIASIYETFPTARVIYLVRNPLEMLPSTISWLGYTWRVFSDPLSPYPFTQEILQFTKHWYAYPLKVLKKTDPSKYLIIKYDDLILNPQETIRQIYAHFDYEMSPDFERQVAEIVKGSGDFRSRHQYNLENMGFSREQILTEFSDIFDQFGFDRSLDGISPTGKESTLD
jgi:omega-hydroxy-beta-dihydromenaquinone-9 sulfotransferase